MCCHASGHGRTGARQETGRAISAMSVPAYQVSEFFVNPAPVTDRDDPENAAPAVDCVEDAKASHAVFPQPVEVPLQGLANIAGCSAQIREWGQPDWLPS